MVNDRDKVLDKVRKCLALSKSANEHEAAAALRQAQKLMRMHALTEEDVGLIEYGSEVVVHEDYKWSQVKPLVVVAVANMVAKAMGVEPIMGVHKVESREVFAKMKYVHAVRYWGPLSRVKVAAFAHEVAYRACTRAWRRYIAENPSAKEFRGARASFYHGWCESVSEKVERLVKSDEEIAKTQAAMDRFYTGGVSQGKLGTRSLYGDVAQAGAQAGQDFQLNRPVGGERRRLCHG